MTSKRFTSLEEESWVRFTNIKLRVCEKFHEKVLVMELGISRMTSGGCWCSFTSKLVRNYEGTSRTTHRVNNAISRTHEQVLGSLSSSRMINKDLLYGVHEQHTENYCRNFTNKCSNSASNSRKPLELGWTKYFTRTIRVRCGGVHEDIFLSK